MKIIYKLKFFKSFFELLVCLYSVFSFFGPFLESPEMFSLSESRSKISNHTITALFYSLIPNSNRGFLHTRSFRITDLFRKTGPRAGASVTGQKFYPDSHRSDGFVHVFQCVSMVIKHNCNAKERSV